ncbi:dihydrofolate reductase [Salvelinus namaycush]|uniref:Dihydrofolate reductase n=1 Tax=Salvelinus namaycush TaxID=8040 RepID=A0A8U1BWT9_SALNM|nr:dihydrofolate reductase [Salvelinus namaycush]
MLNQTVHVVPSTNVSMMCAEKVQKKPLRLIAAACNNMGIGKDGHLPWDLPTEFKFFLDTTTNVSLPGKFNMMVWGRGCWFSNPDSLFSMLPNVLHVVLSTTLSTLPEHAHFLCQDFDSMIGLALLQPLCDLVETIWVVGGPQVYQEALMHPWCELVFLTDIMADFDCDVFFPQFDRSIFKKQQRFPGVPNEIQEENGVTFKFEVFKREICSAEVI